MAASESARRASPSPRLDRHLAGSIIAAMLMGYAMLFSVEIYPLSYILPILLALGFGYHRFYHSDPPLFSENIWTFFSLLLVGGSAAMFFTGRSTMMATLNMILLALPLIKLYTAKGTRDYLQLYALSFSQIIYASVVSFEISYGLVSLAFLALSMWGLILLSHRDGIRKHASQPGLQSQIESAVFKKSHVLFIGLLIPIAAVLSGIIFFTLPRTSSALASFNFGFGKRSSGFSETVSFGQVGEIKLDHSVAMRIKLDGNIPEEPIYWRGALLDNFDGMTWTSTRFSPEIITPKHKRLPYFSITDTHPMNRELNPSALTQQTVYVDGISTRLLIHYGHAVHVELGGPVIRLYPNGNIKGSRRSGMLQRYRVWSTVDNFIRPFKYYMTYNLQLPDKLDPRVEALAKRITANFKSSAEKASAIERHLKDGYSYSLDAGLLPSSDPVSHFLFGSKAGHCEYFATAMTLMLRTQDIPARMVTGYQQGEYNEIEGYYIVRQSDAHAWVEAWIDGNWKRYDPTPAAGWEFYDKDFFSNLQRMLDSVSFRWQRYVVFFNIRDQVAALQVAEGGYHMLKQQSGTELWAWIKGHQSLAGLALLILLLPSLWKLRNILSSRKRNSGLSLSQKSGARSFRKIAGRIKKRGIEVGPSTTASEMVSIAGEIFPEAANPLSIWLGFFNTIRYSGKQINETAIKLLRKAESDSMAALKKS